MLLGAPCLLSRHLLGTIWGCWAAMKNSCFFLGYRSQRLKCYEILFIVFGGDEESAFFLCRCSQIDTALDELENETASSGPSSSSRFGLTPSGTALSGELSTWDLQKKCSLTALIGFCFGMSLSNRFRQVWTSLSFHQRFSSPPAGLNLSTIGTTVLSSSSQKFLEPQALPLVFDLSESSLVNDEPVEDVPDLRLATSFPIVQRCRRLLLKIKQVLLDSCSSKRMQAEDKHKPLDQSSQPSTDPEASKQYSDSFPLILFKSQQLWNGLLCSSKAFGEFTKSGKGSWPLTKWIL